MLPRVERKHDHQQEARLLAGRAAIAAGIAGMQQAGLIIVDAPRALDDGVSRVTFT